jgi:exodeoxyribonuclease V alpha subunit
MSSEECSGRVSRVLYQSQSFHVLKFIPDGKNHPVTVEGHFPGQQVRIGSWLAFEAVWKKHPKYGKQLSVTRSPITVSNWTDDRVLSALSAHNVGPQIRGLLKILAGSKGLSLKDLLDSGDLQGGVLDPDTQNHVLSRWGVLRTHLDAAQFLSDAGLRPKVISKVWSVLGEELEEKVTSDPWILVRVAGVSFKEADEVALRLGVSLDNPGRVQGAVLTAVQQVAKEGHIYALTGQVVQHIKRMLPGAVVTSDVAAGIKTLISERQLVAKREYEGGPIALYEPWVAQMETACAQTLYERSMSKGTGVPRAQAEHELEKWAEGRQVSLADAQKEAALTALTQPIGVITGLPGTGKTTTLQAVVSVLNDCHAHVLLVAPTGIAAKRMEALTGMNAATVHRAFSAKGWDTDGDRESTYVGVVGGNTSTGGRDTRTEEWEYGPHNPHPADVVIVDESSMLDLHMLYRLLQGTRDTCRMIFVGDPYQLPSVGAGDVLRDLATCGRFAHNHLHEIFRQSDTSGIVLAAHDVHGGRTPDLTQPDFKLIPCDNGDRAAEIIRKISARLYDRRSNFQVLSPRHKGDAGVTSLNEIIRTTINPAMPGLSEWRVSGTPIRVGDRIMVVKNDYEKGIYNGDVGKVSDINHQTKTLVIRIFGMPGQPQQEVRYDLTKGVPAIRLAYAQTVHKSQGQEYDVIVVPVLRSFGRQLQRNLLYTAITRAKKRVFLVGEASAVTRAVQNDRADQRNTLLADRIRELMESGGVGNHVDPVL